MGGIRQYYQELNQGRSRIEVPEWRMSFFVGPLTVGQFERIDTAKTDAERNRLIIITCAKDENGFPAFTSDMESELAQYGTTDVVPRVAGEIMQALPRGEEKKV